MKEYNFEQGTEDWYKVRLGKITGSNVQKLTLNTARGIGRVKAAEIITGGYAQSFKGNAATDHGTASEEKALALVRSEFRRVGFVELDEWTGYSPDGIGEDFIVEVKCPYNPPNFLYDIFDTPIEYRRQMQYGMWVCDKPKCLYVVYCEDFPVKVVTQTIYRDESVIEILIQAKDRAVEYAKKYLDQWRRIEEAI